MYGYGERLRAIWGARKLTPMQTLILLVINDYAGGDGACYASVAAIAGKAHCSPKTVSRFLGDLIDAGILSRRPRFDAHGVRLRTDELIVDWPKLDGFAARNRRPEPTPLLDGLDGPAAAAEPPQDLPKDNCGTTDTVSHHPGHGVPSSRTFAPSLPHTPSYVLEHPRTRKEHTPPSLASPATPAPARRSAPLRVCVSLIDRFFARFAGRAPAVGSYTRRELAFAGDLIGRLGIDAAFSLLDRVSEDVRRGFPDCKQFTGSRRHWDKAIADRDRLERQQRARKAAADQYRQISAAGVEEGRKAKERLLEAKSRFDRLPEDRRRHWLTLAQAELPAPVHGTIFAIERAAALAATALEAT